MKRNKAIFILLLLCISLLGSAEGYAFDSINDCLITNDIDIYTFRSQTAHMGEGAGIIGQTGHFKDHIDTVCEGTYSNINEVRGLPVEEARKKILSIDVQVTQHAGAESDKWLLHEVERGFRYGDFEEDMTPSRFRNIDGNNIFYSKLGGGGYRWISNNIVIDIEYTDLYQQKLEPLEVVKAYLVKHPSTIPDMTIDKAHNETWIKDEMERRLWLCDKWFMQLQLGKAEQAEVLKESVEHMEEFLEYREKYYGVSGEEEKDLLDTYLGQKSGTEIKNRLESLKRWWAENKAGAINLP